MDYTYKGKPLEELNKTELIQAIEDISVRLYKSTKEDRFKNLAAFASGVLMGEEDGLDDDGAINLGLLAVEAINDSTVVEESLSEN